MSGPDDEDVQTAAWAALLRVGLKASFAGAGLSANVEGRAQHGKH